MTERIWYTCKPHRRVWDGEDYLAGGDMPTTVASALDAARIFAWRTARKRYGRRGRVATVHIDSWHQSRRYANFEAFIGYADNGGVTGRNEHFTVHMHGQVSA